jgi:hypothetical protein
VTMVGEHSGMRPQADSPGPGKPMPPRPESGSTWLRSTRT